MNSSTIILNSTKLLIIQKNIRPRWLTTKNHKHTTKNQVWKWNKKCSIMDPLNLDKFFMRVERLVFLWLSQLIAKVLHTECALRISLCLSHYYEHSNVYTNLSKQSTNSAVTLTVSECCILFVCFTDCTHI